MQIDEQTMREVIMDHYEHPRQNTLLNDPNYITVRLKNPSCGDDLTIQCQFADDKENGPKLLDIRQKGSGCSICLASASMMADLLHHSTVKQAESAIENFSAMIQDNNYDADVLGDAQALCGISKVIPRIKCANLAWQALQAAIKAQKEHTQEKKQAQSTIEMEIN